MLSWLGDYLDNLDASVHRQRLFVVLVLICAVSITRQHVGIFFDATHYALIALHTVHSAPWDGELLLQGERGNYTLFPRIFGELIAHLGVGPAHKTAVAVGLVLWLTGAVFLSTSLFGVTQMGAISLFILMLANSSYSCGTCAGFAEPFATPRLFAEGLSLVSISLAIRRRFALSGIFLAMAACIHPLMAIPVLGLLILLAACTLTQAAWVFSGLVALGCTLALLGIMPFALLTQAYSADWFSILEATFPNGYFSHWEIMNAARLLPAATSLAVIAVLGTGTHQNLALQLLILFIGLSAISWLGTSVFKNVLITNLHLWRVSWLVAVVGLLMSLTAIRLLRNNPILAFAMAFATIISITRTDTELSIIPAFFVLTACLIQRLATNMSIRTVTVVSLSFTAIFCFVTYFATAWIDLPWPSGSVRILPTAVLLAGAGGLYFLGRGQNVFVGCAIWAFMAVFSALAGTSWDRLPEVDRGYMAQNSDTGRELSAYLGSDLVYWEGDVRIVWYMMKRPAFFSCVQGASNLISENLAHEWNRRGAAIAKLNTLDTRDASHQWCPIKEKSAASGPENISQINSVCAEFPQLGALALVQRIPNTSPDVWLYPALHHPAELVQATDWDAREQGTPPARPLRYLYRCPETRS